MASYIKEIAGIEFCATEEWWEEFDKATRAYIDAIKNQ